MNRTAIVLCLVIGEQPIDLQVGLPNAIGKCHMHCPAIKSIISVTLAMKCPRRVLQHIFAVNVNCASVECRVVDIFPEKTERPVLYNCCISTAQHNLHSTTRVDGCVAAKDRI